MSQPLLLALMASGTLAALSVQAHAEPAEPAEPASDDPSAAEEDPSPARPEEPNGPSSEKAQPSPQRVVVRPGETVNGVTLAALAKRGITWDLTPSAGLRLWRSDEDKTHLVSARLRAGVQLYHEPNFLMLGPSVLVGGVADGIAFGGEIEAASLRGVWVQGGVYADGEGVFGGACLGYTLFGLEFQRRLSGDDEGRSALFLSLHIPISIIRVALQPPPVQAR